jgi:hypothetical protein
MPKCLRQAPPLYQIEEHRAVACFVYEDFPAIGNEEMDSVFKVNGKINGRVKQASG